MKTNSLPGKDRKPSGASLPTVIMVVALMMTLAFTVVAIAFNHLNLSFRSNNSSKAEMLAEATLALAIERVYSSAGAEYGAVGTPGEKTIRLDHDDFQDGSYPSNAFGVLTFDRDAAVELGIPYSTNNRSESSVEGSNPHQGVPGQSLHLVARAEVSGAFSTMEAIVEIPKFPYSIASEGAIRSTGGLLVASVRPGFAYDLSLPILEEDLEPGHIVSNSSIGDQAIVMEGTNKIMGDLRSASGATVDEENTRVFGEMRLNADPVQLPELHAYNYEPAPEDNPQTVNSGAGTLRVSGYNIAEGNLTVDNGINLSGGVLFVDGDLTVSAGGVKGKGALIATGNITINGGGEASTDNQAALIADGDITLRGTSPTDKAKFAGLIYTGGNLSSENLRLAGVFVAGGDGSQVTLENTELYQVEEYAKIELTGQAGFSMPNIEPASDEWETGAGKIPFEVTYDFSGLEANLENYRNPNTGPGQPEYLFKYADYDPPDYSLVYKTQMVNSEGVTVEVVTSGPDQYVLDGSDIGLRMFGQPVSSSAEAESISVAAMATAVGRPLTTGEQGLIKGIARRIFQANQVSYAFSVHSVDQIAAGAGGGGGDPSAPFRWSLDMSEFIEESQRMRVLYWARYVL